MSALRFTVERDGYGYIVCDRGLRVYGPGSEAQALNKRDRLERAARRKRRACITCGTSFMSDGPHNRMCTRCRAQSREMFEGAV